MCGISGFINSKSSSKEKASILRNMIEIQNHRGPDSNGTYIDEIIGLAHNRLSLLDLSTHGSQPFEDEDHVLIYNGEIYNYLDIKKQLPERQYKSTSDTEVLFWTLKAIGVLETLKKLNGMFAFAWYEKKTNKLFLCRDRLGIKPLFYGTDKNGNFVFASELKTIVRLFDFEADPIKVMYASLGILEKSIDFTAFKNLNHLTPGTYIEIGDGKIVTNEYFNLLDLVDEAEYKRLNNSTAEVATAQFEDILKKSTESMLVSDAPMGCFVSGGIDSSILSHYASQYREDLKLFTANVLGKYSEFNDAKTLATSLNKELFDYKYSKEKALEDFAEVVYHYDSPLITHFNAIAFSKVASLARLKKVKAVLTGEGADELFLGYPKLLTQKYNSLIQAPYTFINSIYSKIPGLSGYINKSSRSEGLLSILEMGSQNFTRQYLRNSGIEKYGFLPRKEALEAYQTAEMLQDRLVSLLWRNDRMGMIHSIESRFPFLDENMLKFSLNLPTRFKIGRINKFYNYKHPFMIDKRIVRQASERFLPQKLVYKKKFGFATHDLREVKVKHDFFKNGIIAEYLGLSNQGLNHLTNSISDYHLALLASTELWAKIFIQKLEISEVREKVLHNFSFKNATVR